MIADLFTLFFFFFPLILLYKRCSHLSFFVDPAERNFFTLSLSFSYVISRNFRIFSSSLPLRSAREEDNRHIDPVNKSSTLSFFFGWVVLSLLFPFCVGFSKKP